ncbi:MAG: hypothetical protein ACRD3A_12985 [Terriglobales bacterium]
MNVRTLLWAVPFIAVGFVAWNWDWWRQNGEAVYYASAVLAAGGAVWIYFWNSRLEKAKWGLQLYEKFYESDKYKATRDALDCEADSADVKLLVEKENPEFTDYLNFFEFVAFLEESQQLEDQQVETLFDYYLSSLSKHSSVLRYVGDKNKGFEKLRKKLAKI